MRVSDRDLLLTATMLQMLSPGSAVGLTVTQVENIVQDLIDSRAELVAMKEDLEAYEAMKEGVTTRVTDLEKDNTHCRNLLAIIHRDGGHHTNKVGLEQSCKDAVEVVGNLRITEESE